MKYRIARGSSYRTRAGAQGIGRLPAIYFANCKSWSGQVPFRSYSCSCSCSSSRRRSWNVVRSARHTRLPVGRITRLQPSLMVSLVWCAINLANPCTFSTFLKATKNMYSSSFLENVLKLLKKLKSCILNSF